MKTVVLHGKLQSGKNDASKWMNKFNEAYSRKAGMPIFPGSLNLALSENFNWSAPEWQSSTIWFGREEYGGERDILLLPCTLPQQGGRKAFLWTPTTTAKDRPDPWVVELITDVGMRQTYGLNEGDTVAVEIDCSPAPAP